ncbi:MAG: family 78 glycoside hydrolase catalytic domain [Terrimicrobiaceae bacterium]
MIHSFIRLPESSFLADSYTALRGHFAAPAGGTATLRLVGASWYQVWLDGQWLTEGPYRFVPERPEYEALELSLEPGNHVLSVALNFHGVETRLLQKSDPFLMAELILPDGSSLPISWKARPLEGFRPAVRRINPQLAWCEWCDTRSDPENWQAREFDDGAWSDLGLKREDRPLAPVQLERVRQIPRVPTLLAEGVWTELFGYETDDPPMRFLLRDLAPRDLPPQGVWRRYDLGRVRLSRPRITLDLPPGTVVEMAYAEDLHRGRVAPVINISLGASCNLDHYVSRGGAQEFGPLAPRGGRYLEVHVRAEARSVRWIDALALERCYYGEAQSSFHCSDPLLNEIWSVGHATFRACCEDALTDNPTRERGQWTGDVCSVGMNIAAACYGDLRLLRRGLLQSAQSAKDSGLVAGLCPGGAVYLGSYAAQWVTACVEYHQLTGDVSLLTECLPCAERNLAAFDPFLAEDGLRDGIDWPFIDWGFLKEEGAINLPMNLHLLAAFRSFRTWCGLLGDGRREKEAAEKTERLETILKSHVAVRLQDGFVRLGYHGAALALAANIIPQDRREEGIRYLKAHILDCFPNNPLAPRLSDPDANNSRLITPYFAHYAFKVLIEAGEIGFVLDQYRHCWGWMLQQEPGTLLEVFDTRWSHCHQWSGCPTWQLSRYVLGLWPRRDQGDNAYEFCLRTGNLGMAEGTLPITGTDQGIRIRWERKDAAVEYRVASPTPIEINGVPGMEIPVHIHGEWSARIESA